MNQKELNEIRRRFKPDRDSITRIYGCYVNASREVVSYIDMSVGLMPEEEAEMYIKLLKKSISGTLGRNLLDIEFSTSQVSGSEEHGLLMKLRDSELKDEAARESFYTKIIESADMGDKSYVILLASDTYDVPFRGGDGEVWSEGSDEVFRYFICGVYPVKDASMALRYFADEKEFRSTSTGHVVAAPEIGFMFPAFDDRTANIYNALYYTKDSADSHEEFTSEIFHSEIPMPAQAQKELFQSILEESVSEECSYDVMQNVHEQISAMVEEHKVNKEEEPLTLSKRNMTDVLEYCGVDEEHINSFAEKYDSEFGADAQINPKNIVDVKKFELSTPDITIKVNPERKDLISTRIIDGVKYIMIRAEENVEVNGVNINIT